MSVKTIVLLHDAGGSARSWNAISSLMPSSIVCVALDLPGFGEAGNRRGESVAVMAAEVAARLGQQSLGRWLLIGHGMGGKVALAIARLAEDGFSSLANLAGLVLLCPSPPGPEPATFRKNWSWIDAGASDREEGAARFISQNCGISLPAHVAAGAIDDALLANPIAWKRWLRRGSQEDLRARIGVLQTPALVFSGAADMHFRLRMLHERLVPHLTIVGDYELSGAGALLPLERPDSIALLVSNVFALPKH